MARVCTAIAEEPELASDYTWVSNTVAVVTDGTAVLGLGDIGPAAALPVMEGKALLFKQFGGVDAVPICLDCTDVDEIVETVVRLAPGLRRDQPGGHLRAALLRDRGRGCASALDIPVFHDDQHGTAIVVLAALRNAARLAGKHSRRSARGRGRRGRVRQSRSPGSCWRPGIGDIAVADSKGMSTRGRDGLNPVKRELAAVTNTAGCTGSPEAALRGADVFIGLSGGTVPEDGGRRDGRRTRSSFALANPEPEVHPDVARRHAAWSPPAAATSPTRSTTCSPSPASSAGRWRSGAAQITEGMKLAAADALAAVVGDDSRRTT